MPLTIVSVLEYKLLKLKKIFHKKEPKNPCEDGHLSDFFSNRKGMINYPRISRPAEQKKASIFPSARTYLSPAGVNPELNKRR